ncbi:hypothetical protein HNQ02_002992 [Flavobacterium sp. 7E]|uniref:hypothetical protein n=1 Tax=Flavobacterium sp. 7E TaxID=2735898 RepID=UPI00156FDB40|nr:hypothetical protein [Flavobacterium sp. 7E]NRS90057.1 hypothetical protein [Flavobacterium sp. 7E]
MIKKKNIIPLLILLAFIIFVLCAQLRSFQYENRLKREGQSAIGRVDSIVRFPKSSAVFISYIISNKKYNSFESALDKKISSEDVGRFYEFRYLLDSPKIVRGNYFKEITDTVAILNAGFSREEIVILNKN